MIDDSIKNVQQTEALQKIKEIVVHARNCQMMTSLGKRPIPTRPMAIQKIDPLGRIYFLSGRNSGKNREISTSNEMQLTIANEGNSEYLSIYGYAEIFRDQEQIDEMYTGMANNWFSGKNDPNISIIRFIPKDGHYWDTKHGKIAQFVDMIVGTVSGKPSSESVEGKIEL
jgi:general stress protein 26